MTAPDSDPKPPPRAPVPTAPGEGTRPPAGEARAFTKTGSAPPPTGSAPTGAVRSAGTLLAIGISLLALVVALGSAVFAWRAIDQAKDAENIALSRVAGSTAGGASSAPGTDPDALSPGETGEAAAPDEPPVADEAVPVDPNSTDAPLLNERTSYASDKSDEELTLTAECGYSMYVDVDEPRANVPSEGHDLRFQMGCRGNTSYLALGDGVAGSTAVGLNVTPAECSDKIRRAPLAGAEVPVRKGTVLCLHTDYFAARKRGEDWRMVVIRITGVAVDGVTTVELDSWRITPA